MSDKNIAEMQRELERTHKQIRDVESTIADVVSSREIAQNIIKVTVEQMHEGLQIVDREFRYLYLNEAASAQGDRKRTDLIGKQMLECFPQLKGSEFFERLTSSMHNRETDRMENHFERADGKKFWFDIYLEPHPMGVLIRSIDISDRKQLEENLQHTQKMESIGRLAGGIAHDFNNKLGILTLYCEMAASKVESDPAKVKEYIVKMQGAIQQATTLTRQLLAFSRKQVLDPKVCCLNDILANTHSTLGKMIGENIRLDYFLAPDLGNVKVDASQIDQILLNLCVNARDALPNGGVVTTETRR